MNKIYLDHASTSPLDSSVIEMMIDCMKNNYGNPSSIHSLGRKSRILIEDARKIIAESLNVSIGEIYFTSSATESNNTALIGAVRDLGIQRIISTRAEHDCVLNTLLSMSSNTELIFLNLDKRGNINYDQLEDLLNAGDKKTMVSLMHVNNEIGTMLDIARISELCKDNKSLFHTDAVQSMGKFKLDLHNIKVSFLSATAHKINGPKGCGFIYINSENSIAPMMIGGSQERNMRAGTENVHGIVGFGKTMDLWKSEREKRMNKIESLRKMMKEILDASGKDIKYTGNQDELYAPHILNVNIPRNSKSEMIMMNLDIAGICASSGSACSSGAEHDSHVLEAINADKNRKAIRFSFSYMSSEAEVQEAAKKFIEII